MMNASVPDDGEAQLSIGDRKRGGWITFPFILVMNAGMSLAAFGWMSNLTVYLIEEFQVKSITAAQISSFVNGCGNLIPVVGAIIADSFLGCFSVVWISSCISLLQPCKNGPTSCHTTSPAKYAVLYGGIALASIGFGGMRSNVVTMGANQFSKAKDQDIYFNWYFFTTYASALIGTTALVYIQDNVGWDWGFGSCGAANLLALAIFLLGSRCYLHVKPHGSPFTGMARVIVASIRKGKASISTDSKKFFHGHETAAPTKSFRFLNRAAIMTEGDTKPDGSIAKPWNLCTVQEVEDLKALIRILPLWTSSIFLSTPIGMQGSLVVLQALTMDRQLGHNFKIPAGSFLVFLYISSSISLAVFDRFLWPTWRKMIGPTPRPLQRVGTGHVLNALGMAVSALVEMKRLKIARAHQSLVVAKSALWLVPQLAIVGIGEAFHLPGQVALYYQEFPKSLKTVSTAMIALQIGIAYYLSTALLDLVRRVTRWLPNNINDGRIDNVYWVLFVIGALNFGYYLLCSCLYKYKNVEKVRQDSSSSVN